MSATYSGPLGVGSEASAFNAHAFLISQMIGKAWTATLVQVQAVSNAGGVAAVGTVDVLPMVAQIDGQGQATPHGIIYGLPYFRLQGGANAVILDPQIGDIGIAVFASRDISSVKANKAPANPGSRRRNDPADGLYIGGVLNGVPTQYIQFATGGLTIVSTGTITITAPTVNVAGVLQVGGVTVTVP